jgi:4-amino-4-deoxy-L-arabinose transferase-like glycosyltransferase
MRTSEYQQSDDSRVSAGLALLWIVCLSFVSVALKNFEEGLSRDAPLYATIARNIAQTGEWFRLHGSIPEFTPFAEHPHLGFWVLASVFKVFPIADWSARIPGHLFYVLTLWMLFLYIRRLATERAAAWTILLLWIWFRFSNFYSTVYLDPGCLFFGLAALVTFDRALRDDKPVWSLVSGLCLAASAMYKGLTVLAFLPAFLPLLWLIPGQSPDLWRRRGLCVLGVIVGTAALSGLYLYAIKHSLMPNFLEMYWFRQMTNRFSHGWHLHNLWDGLFWRRIVQDTYQLLYLLPLSFLIWRRGLAFALPMTLLATFLLMYGGGNRIGFQYLIMFMPWIAWLIAQTVLEKIPVSGPALVRSTMYLAIALTLIGQYIPIRVHSMPPPIESADIRELKAHHPRMVLFVNPPPNNFSVISTYAWYTGLAVDAPKTLTPLPEPLTPAGDILMYDAAVDPRPLEKQGWCLERRYPNSTLWVPCAKDS